MMYTINRELPALGQFDVCVLGGSCTGLFAAIRAARLGCRVCVVEMTNCFGGVAANALVTIWHTRNDRFEQEEIIAGLTAEVMERLARRHAIEQRGAEFQYFLNTEELKIELDELAKEAGVTPYFHSTYAGPVVRDGALEAVLVATKSGLRVIWSRFFIDCTGDGDLLRDLEVPAYLPAHPQPASASCKLAGDSIGNLRTLIHEHGDEVGLRPDSGWSSFIPGVPGVSFHNDTHVFDLDFADVEGLTAAEIEGRRQVRAVHDLIRKYQPDKTVGLCDLAAYLGIRETRHFACAHKLLEEELLSGKRFPDAVANGTYSVDIHHDDKPGLTYKYLDGTMKYCRDGYPPEYGRWLPEGEEGPAYYQVPYGVLVPQSPYPNLLCAGRMLDCDEGAFGAVRVMVNFNQLGEAAGVAAAESLLLDIPAKDVDPVRLRQSLAAGGSAIQ